MANIKFMTVKGSLGSEPYYIGIPQHERTLTKKEAYAFAANNIGFKATAIRAAFLALRKCLKDNAERGNYTTVDGLMSVRNYVRGSFAALNGPWIKGKNMIQLEAIELDPFKSTLAGVVPTNNTDGAKPSISSVFDEVTGEYDEITGTDEFTIAGQDLGPDTEKDDEYVAFINDKGVETKAVTSYSDLQVVKAALSAALPAGQYTLAVYTRSGMGDEFGVRKITKKVVIK